MHCAFGFTACDDTFTCFFFRNATITMRKQKSSRIKSAHVLIFSHWYFLYVQLYCECIIGSAVSSEIRNPAVGLWLLTIPITRKNPYALHGADDSWRNGQLIAASGLHADNIQLVSHAISYVSLRITCAWIRASQKIARLFSNVPVVDNRKHKDC